MKTLVSWQLPIKAANESNASCHWTKTSKRHKLQKCMVKSAFILLKPNVSLPCHVVLTRIAPRSMDEKDNLRMSFKWIADAVAENLIPGLAIGRADDDKRITWEYKQEKGEVRQYAVKIEILVKNDI